MPLNLIISHIYYRDADTYQQRVREVWQRTGQNPSKGTGKQNYRTWDEYSHRVLNYDLGIAVKSMVFIWSNLI